MRQTGQSPARRAHRVFPGLGTVMLRFLLPQADSALSGPKGAIQENGLLFGVMLGPHGGGESGAGLAQVGACTS